MNSSTFRRCTVWQLLTVVVLLDGAGNLQGQTIYGSAYTGFQGQASLYTINPTNGTATLVGPIGFPRVGAIAFSPSGTLYGVADPVDGPPVLITINRTTGAGTEIGLLNGSEPVQDMSFRHS